jgi:hypothetical protein
MANGGTAEITHNPVDDLWTSFAVGSLQRPELQQ